ncbi:prolipoprotein diacylglyceryl transferase [Limibacillus halophilus]|jgi:phosphatidylglycerol:prolipoprotein diacylglycerol transferase
MLFAFVFPQIDPVAVQLGPFAIRWYALAYIVGLVLGWRLCRRLTKKTPAGSLTPEVFDDFVVWATLGVLLGGRLGYVLFYNLGYFAQNPLEILQVWQGGMAFHGGLLGVIAALFLFSWKRKVPLFALSDLVAAAAPIGLFFGRIANFVNGELYGRVTDAPWGMVFPGGGDLPRHPSQLYEAGLEGILLFAILQLAIWRGALARPGVVGGLFLAGYGASRAIVELFREPDAHIGFLEGGLTMGQLLSLPMVVAGLGLALWAWRRGAEKA